MILTKKLNLNVNALPANFISPLPQYDCLPFVMYDFCIDCTKFHHNLSCAITTIMFEHDSMHFAYGVRCRYSVIAGKKAAFCAGYNSCVSLYKDDPQTYTIRPIQRIMLDIPFKVDGQISSWTLTLPFIYQDEIVTKLIWYSLSKIEKVCSR
uniref:Uncharacterized protein n=1 Tax=Romanomermis culicivorax TaxID=13658 RepID=A0A915JHC5_ROMCU